MSTDNLDQIVEAFVAIRDARAQAKADFELKDKELEEQQDALKAVMLSVCNDMKAESIKTEHGLVMRQLKERFFSADWASFGAFVVENNVPDLYEKRIHQGNMKKFLEDQAAEAAKAAETSGGEKSAEVGLPPGVSVSREYDIVVRRAPGK